MFVVLVVIIYIFFLILAPRSFMHNQQFLPNGIFEIEVAIYCLFFWFSS